ncbi:MAG: M15 family metallopeptidase [Oscillospiraceae bacterium]|nr:M15 family metallopeptidase [Oscillospiraceae bacterium]
MKNYKKSRSQTVTIFVAICVLTAIAFGLFYIFMNPNADLDGDSGRDGDINTSPQTNETPGDGQTAPPGHQQSTQSPDVEYITVFVSPDDINRGDLILVNKDNPYVPADIDLAVIDDVKTVPYAVSPAARRLKSSVMSRFDDMMQGFIDATGENIIYVISAYRNLDDQQAILDLNISQMGREEALRQTALPGFSEHHTGLAVDYRVIIDGVQHPFADFEVTKWYRDNAYRYGFVLRYPEGKEDVTDVMSEPWHFRFVGLPHSYIMRQNGWVLEEYIEAIRGYTVYEPLKAEYDNISYEVFFTTETDIKVPEYSRYEISGNNADGFIVTITR